MPKNAKAKKNQKRNIFLLRIGIGVCIFALGSLATLASVKLWPANKKEDRHRVSEVASICRKKDNNDECKKLAQDNNVIVEYCHSLYNIPTLHGETPVYMVARSKSFEPELPNYAELTDNWFNKNEINTNNWYPFYGCADTEESARSLSGPSKLNQEGARKALKSLSDIPKFEVSGDVYKCSVSYPDQLSEVWSWIPDSKEVMDDWKSFQATHHSCDQLESVRQKANEITSLFNEYANNYTVQLYYEAYDKSDPYPVWLTVNIGVYAPDKSITDFAQAMGWYSASDSFVAEKV